MKSIVVIVLVLMVLSFLWSLFMGAIKIALLIGAGVVVVGIIKAILGKSESSGSP